MRVQKVRLSECNSLRDTVVVIDVIRAFTTTAFAFSCGVEKIILVGEVEEALRLHKRFPDALLGGEVQGIPIPGFHFDNSPVGMERAGSSLKDKTIIFRSSSGTQGVVRSVHASRMLVSSFVSAEATLNHLRSFSPQSISFVITGTTKGGFEDLALADYLEYRLLSGNIDSAPYIERVRQSPSGMAYAREAYPHFRKHDLEACCMVDKFPFAQEVFREENLFVLRPVSVGKGEPLPLRGEEPRQDR